MSNSYLVPAVNNSTINVKDYGATGDGTTDDYAAFKDAIASLSSTGGTILFPEGTYLFSDISTYAVPVDNLTIRLQEGATVKVPSTATVGTDTSPQGTPFKPIIGANEGTDSAFDNFSIYGGEWIIEKDDVTAVFINTHNCSNLKFYNMRIDGSGAQSNNKAYYGIYTRFANDVIMANCEISYTTHAALRPEISNRCHVHDNIIQNAGVDKTYVSKTAETVDVHWYNSWGISASACSDLLIENNRLDQIGGAGIGCRGGASNALRRLTVRNNYLTNVGKGGIGAGMITGTGAVDHHDVLIEGNKIYGFAQRTADHGIQLHNNSTVQVSKNIIVRDNTVSMWYHGDDDTTYTAHDEESTNIIYGISVTSDKTDEESTGVIVDGNRVYNTLSAGIYVSAAHGSVSNNYIENCSYKWVTGSAGVFNFSSPQYSTGMWLTGYNLKCMNNTLKNLFKTYTSGSACAVNWTVNQGLLENTEIWNDGTNYDGGYAVKVSTVYTGGSTGTDSPAHGSSTGGLRSLIKNTHCHNCNTSGVYDINTLTWGTVIENSGVSYDWEDDGDIVVPTRAKISLNNADIITASVDPTSASPNDIDAAKGSICMVRNLTNRRPLFVKTETTKDGWYHVWHSDNLIAGTTSGTPSSGILTVTHNLGDSTPVFLFSVEASVNLHGIITSKASNTCNVTLYDDAGATYSAGSVTLHWVAIFNP